MIKTATQLKAKVRNLSGGDSTKAQTLIRNFIMERFLERIALSPYYRLKRSEIGAAYEKRGGAGEKAVASYDEDSFTMALAAAANCRAETGVRPDALFFASVTAPNAEKQCAAQIASALDIEGELRTGDFSGSMRAGTAAMLSALDLAAAKKTALVTAADTRLGAPNGQYEDTFGDYAAAFLFGPDPEVAELAGSYSVSHDFTVSTGKQEKSTRTPLMPRGCATTDMFHSSGKPSQDF